MATRSEQDIATARTFAAELNGNVTAFYADHINYAEFCRANAATWDAVHAAGESVGRRVAALLRRDDAEVLNPWLAETRRLEAEFGVTCELDYDPDAPMPFAVWFVNGGERQDIVGCGPDSATAVSEAHETLSAWGPSEEPAQRPQAERS